MIDYENPTLQFLDDEISDLVTINQGLHHLPQEQILSFIREIYRVLRPGGVFIVREHDWDEESNPNLLPMLDVAHMVFNVVTGVSHRSERLERRAFRSIREWREIISSVGFCDSMLYEIQEGDPTIDEMMCFYKPPLWDTEKPARANTQEDNLNLKSSSKTIASIEAIEGSFNGLPNVMLDGIKQIISDLTQSLHSWNGIMKEKTGSLSTGQKFIADNLLDKFFEPLEMFLSRFIPLLEHVHIKEETSGTFIPPEIGLALKAIVKKVEEGKGSPMEMLVASYIKDIEEAISLASVEEPEELRRPEVESLDIDPLEVQNVLEHVLFKLPELKHSSICENMGLGYLASRAAVQFHSSLDFETDLSKASNIIAGRLDKESWENLKLALNDICEQQLLPTLDRIVDQENPWHKVVFSVFSSPRVKISRSFSWKASAAGLGDILMIYRKAKMNSPTRSVSTIYQQEIKEVIGNMNKGNRKRVRFEEGNFRNIRGVFEIVEAKYGYESLTAKFVDVTEALQRLYLKGDVIKIAGEDLTKAFSEEGLMPWGLWDNLRKTTIGKSRSLIVTYYSTQKPDMKTLDSRFSKIKEYLREEGWIKKHGRGHLTWFKLVEWMQVEIIQQFGNSMEHTPWYRFPFVEYISTYFDIFYKEIMIVKDKQGWSQALFSEAFFVDLIPGIVMSFIMMQMQALALPLKMVGGDEYETSKLVEYVTLYVPYNMDHPFKEFDENIIEEDYIGEGLYSLTVPTFKGLTAVLRNISFHMSDAYVIDISGNSEIQLKARFNENSEHLYGIESSSPEGCKYLFQYSQSMDLDQKKEKILNVSFQVQVIALLETIKWLESCNAEMQLYDFFD
eukprot:TRINITY_DN5265_c0_g1_i1.p1 TRINITY_DN5265_c0_g1~~TRINITY_DN5265_c0_g1_i1.p1  ORF type:complete len:846 (-),score=152.13 TRINITY_DN5265_c0_g1_i1:17-2554(-)